MRKKGAGQRWKTLDSSVLHKHDLAQLATEAASPVQGFEPPGGRPFTVDLTFLSPRPELARVLTNSFRIIYPVVTHKATVDRIVTTLKLFNRFLSYRSKAQSDVRTAKQLSTDMLKEFAVWLVAKRRLKRKSAAGLFAACCLFLLRARRLYPREFDEFFSAPKNLFAGADNERTESRALSLADFRKILLVAETDVRRIVEAYKPGDVPTSPHDLIPFMVIVAARTGINPKALYDLERGCLSPHELDENLFYCAWDKPRAGKQQRQLHRIGPSNHPGVVEVIRYLLRFTEPLAAAADPMMATKLFMYRAAAANLRGRLIAPSVSPDVFNRYFHVYARRNQLSPFTLANIRPSAATQLYLETGGNLRKVQQFLQHAHLRTTVNYVLNSITEPFNARAIQRAQEQMIVRVTVIPAERSVGVVQLGLPPMKARRIVAGKFDTGCGACRDPYDSPQPGEKKGSACTSFHACFTCPNGLWFLEDLPYVIATRNRLVSLRSDMSSADWNAVYGESVQIIEEQIIAAFRPEQIRCAEVQSEHWNHRPVLVTKGALA